MFRRAHVPALERKPYNRMVMRFFLCFSEKRKEKRKDFIENIKMAPGMGGRGLSKKEEILVSGASYKKLLSALHVS